MVVRGIPAPEHNSNLPVADDHDQSPDVLVFDGPGQLADGTHHVECRLTDNGYRVRVHGVASFWVNRSGSHFGCDHLDPGTRPAVVAAAALGPPLVLALALQGVFCLHASAVSDTRRVVGFVGSSGSGKSTLARSLSELTQPRWQLVADDVLAVSVEQGHAVALPQFPQLKLSAAAQPWNTQPRSLPLASVYALTGDTGADGVDACPLPMIEGVVAILKHSVAAHLFGKTLRQRHLDACTQLAQTVPVSGLTYPWHTPTSVAEVSRLICRDLDAPPAEVPHT